LLFLDKIEKIDIKLNNKLSDDPVKAVEVIYRNLSIDKELKEETHFCESPFSLNSQMLPSVYFDNRDANLNKKQIKEFLNTMKKAIKAMDHFPDLLLQFSGNTDHIGSNVENKNLGDRMWTYLVMTLRKANSKILKRLRGISKGEECQTIRRNDQSEDEWRAENRRVDFEWILK